jgi:arylsulfatase A-like enzyme
MTSPLSRRDFLKLGGLVPLSLAAPQLLRRASTFESASNGRQNVLIVVFDALSASNLWLCGYTRDTMPILKNLARRAIVYHNHYANSNFTTSGTASLLTGTLPWTHRAIESGGQVAARFATQSMLETFADYYRITFTQNSWALTLLNQLLGSTDELVPRERLFLGRYDGPIERMFYRDNDAAEVAWSRSMKRRDGYSYSLFFSNLYAGLRRASIAGEAQRFPRGLPWSSSGDSFLLEDSTSWLADHLRVVPRPFLGYLHFLPPHSPYNTSAAFFDQFKSDGLQAPVKAVEEFGTEQKAAQSAELRRRYDEFLLYVDQCFGEFYESLRRSGLLDDTWLIVTSDHGEMFERGINGHDTPTLYEPVIRTPLLIFEPGRETGEDVGEPSSAVDLLATLAHVTGHEIPAWCEGRVLTPFAQTAAAPERPIFAIQARESLQTKPLSYATISMRLGRHKIIHYMGYPELEPDGLTRLFDLEADPDEMLDQASARPSLTAELMELLRSRLARADEPYQGLGRQGGPTTDIKDPLRLRVA